MRTVLIACMACLSCLPYSMSQAQVLTEKNPLETYIAEGLKNNIVVQQKGVSLEKALLALQTAKSLFLPSVAFQMNYQTADGGRNIPLPLGDLLNGAYATLNQLTNSQNFPQLENQSITFLPKNFYDAKLRTTVPVINSDIVYNRKISAQQVVLQEFEVETYRRELVKNIKSAYFNYLTALNAVVIYQSTIDLASEGKRMNEKLLENGKGLPAYVLRANSEIAAAQAQFTQAKQQVENAKLYFNSLLNRPGDSPVDTAYNADAGLVRASVQLKEDSNPAGREELKSLQQGIRINETVVKMNKSYRIPKLSGFLDIGSQAEDWKYNDQSRYYLAGLQLDLPVFTGNRNQQKIKQASLDLRNAQLNLDLVKQQLELSSSVARNNLKAAWETYRSAQVQLEAAESYQRLIERGFRAGTNTYIETVDARTQLTSARMALLTNKYNVLAASAALERETASYTFSK
ncbi:TolC family protein [Arcticibacter tournemirensis]|uniref:TolC family protein n=1 Tax=Arcticibacter tournemirensis TaxID=699437 RepID=A0A4V1KHG9_9SPHI|nr:TolC family protein [Arcticibacter tournemirensis]RXF67152.1 TolC family protein [Arcticibacter tournemirensis]